MRFCFLLLAALQWIQGRGPIDPFLSGDTFRAHCDFAYDEMERDLDPKEVPPKSIIFTNGDHIDEFFAKIHPHLGEYLLVVHNGDWPMPGPYRAHLDDPKLLGLFAQNLDGTVHPKLYPLPIGLENRQWNASNWQVLQKAKAQSQRKLFLLYSNFNPTTFPLERGEITRLLNRQPYTYTSGRKPYVLFVNDLAHSKFVLSPRGNGLDTHRLWEALYAGSYPIVKSSPIDALYEGLPVVVVQEWSEVNEEFLHRKFGELSQRTDYEWERLTVDFYLKQMRAVIEQACKVHGGLNQINDGNDITIKR